MDSSNRASWTPATRRRDQREASLRHRVWQPQDLKVPQEGPWGPAPILVRLPGELLQQGPPQWLLTLQGWGEQLPPDVLALLPQSRSLK